MNISVVIPTYNESENLPGLVSALFDLPLDLRVLIVDDNSPDGTGQLADKLAIAYPGKIWIYFIAPKNWVYRQLTCRAFNS